MPAWQQHARSIILACYETPVGLLSWTEVFLLYIYMSAYETPEQQELAVFETVDNLSVPHKLLNPSYGHPTFNQNEYTISFFRGQISRYLHASLGICKLLVIANEMLLIPRVLFHTFVVLNVPEHYLAEAVKICDVGHLAVE
jgi:hypothetical protein